MTVRITGKQRFDSMHLRATAMAVGPLKMPEPSALPIMSVAEGGISLEDSLSPDILLVYTTNSSCILLLHVSPVHGLVLAMFLQRAHHGKQMRWYNAWPAAAMHAAALMTGLNTTLQSVLRRCPYRPPCSNPARTAALTSGVAQPLTVAPKRIAHGERCAGCPLARKARGVLAGKNSRGCGYGISAAQTFCR